MRSYVFTIVCLDLGLRRRQLLNFIAGQRALAFVVVIVRHNSVGCAQWPAQKMSQPKKRAVSVARAKVITLLMSFIAPRT